MYFCLRISPSELYCIWKPCYESPERGKEGNTEREFVSEDVGCLVDQLKSKGGCREIYTDVMNSVFLIHATPFGEGLPV